MKHPYRLLALFFFISIFALVPISEINAYTSGIASVDEFRENSVDIYQIITFNYTDVDSGDSMLMTIRNDGNFAEDIQARAAGELGSNDRLELKPKVTSVWKQTPYEIMQMASGNYTGCTYAVQRTFLNKTTTFYNVTDLVANTSNRNTETHTGYRFQATLLPAEDVAYDWCRKNGAILNTVDAVNLSITMNNEIVDFLSVQTSEEMEVDTDLSNGYQPVPVEAGFISAAAAGFLIKLVAIIAFSIVLIVWAVTSYVPFDFSTTTIINHYTDQSFRVNWSTPDLNESELWAAYLSHCNDTGEIPTVEGYTEYVKNFYDAITPDLDPNWNNNWTTTPTGGSGGNILTNIVGFIKELGPMVIMIILIVAFAFGFFLVIKVAKRIMPGDPPKRKR